MNKIRYLIALLYNDIKSRRPDGTPYFNVRVYMAFGLWLHLLQVLLLLELTANIQFIPKDENSFIGCAFLFTLMIFYLMTWLFPVKDLIDVKVSLGAVKKVKYYYWGYFILNMCVLVLLFKTGH